MNIRNRSEHALIHREQQIRDPATSHRGSSQCMSEANIAKIPHKLAGGVGERQGVAPEEPLEGCHPRGHQREPY